MRNHFALECGEEVLRFAQPDLIPPKSFLVMGMQGTRVMYGIELPTVRAHCRKCLIYLNITLPIYLGLSYDMATTS